MLDTGVRFAASFLPAGVALIVGIVLAVQRRRVQPAVARPALVGLILHLVAVLLGSLVVILTPALLSSGVSVRRLAVISSTVGLLTAVVIVLAWTMLLIALFRRLPASASGDRTPTGRHALVDSQGDQVVAEESMNLYPTGPVATAGAVGAGVGAAGMGDAFGTGAFADSREPGEAFGSGPVPGPEDRDEPRTEVVPIIGPGDDPAEEVTEDDEAGSPEEPALFEVDEVDGGTEDTPDTDHDAGDEPGDTGYDAEVGDGTGTGDDAEVSTETGDDAEVGDDTETGDAVATTVPADEPRAHPDLVPEDEVEDDGPAGEGPDAGDLPSSGAGGESVGGTADDGSGDDAGPGDGGGRSTTVGVTDVADSDDHVGTEAAPTTALGSIDDVDEREQTHDPAADPDEPSGDEPSGDEPSGPSTARESDDDADPATTETTATGTTTSGTATSGTTTADPSATPPTTGMARFAPTAGPFARRVRPDEDTPEEPGNDPGARDAGWFEPTGPTGPDQR